jgi:transcriptional regulator with XRE-family HTH domain
MGWDIRQIPWRFNRKLFTGQIVLGGFQVILVSVNAIVVMKKQLSRYDEDAVTRRLQIVRTMKSGDNQAEFARQLGISRTRWNNLECGYPLSMQMAYMLTNLVDGLTIEWLIEGRDYYLPAPLRARLKEAELSMFPSSERRSAKK